MSVIINAEEDGIAHEYIVNGAPMRCSNGSLPSMIRTNPKNVSFDGEPICTVADNNAIANNFNFGICMLTQKPCTGCIKLLKWSDFKRDFLICGSHVLLDKSYINCALGGKITFIISGQ